VNPKLQSRRHSSASPFVINEVSKLKGSDSLLEDWRLPCIILPPALWSFGKRSLVLLGDFVRSPTPAESRKFYLISTLQIH